jgi:hypothetical protein
LPTKFLDIEPVVSAKLELTGAMPTLVVGMRASLRAIHMPMTSVGMAPLQKVPVPFFGTKNDNGPGYFKQARATSLSLTSSCVPLRGVLSRATVSGSQHHVLTYPARQPPTQKGIEVDLCDLSPQRVYRRTEIAGR